MIDFRREQKTLRLYGTPLKSQACLQEVWISYGHILRDSGRLDEAQAAYREAIRLARDEPQGHFYLGFVLKERGELRTP